MILLPNQLFFAEVEAMLSEGREVQIRMKGHSMRPLLRSERDQVVLTPCTDPARLRPGDVVLFRCCKFFDSPAFLRQPTEETGRENPRTGNAGVRPVRGFRGMCGNIRRGSCGEPQMATKKQTGSLRSVFT